jgi:hypothetical protein
MSCALVSIRDELRGFTREVEPGTFTGEQATQMVAVAGEIERLAGAAKALFAKRVADTGAWQADGHRSVAHWLADRSGTSVGEAGATLAAVGKLDGLGAATDAFRHGRLSGPQVREIAEAASVDPSTEAELLATAATDSLRALREHAQRARAAGEDETRRHERIKKSRYLRSGMTGDGAFELHYRDTADAGADVLAALQPFADRSFRTARAEGRHEPPEAYRADALVALARTATATTATTAGPADGQAPPNVAGPGRNAKIIVRIDHSALVRGHAVSGETCEIAGIGPIPVASVKAMLDDAFLAAVITKGQAVATVAHLGRQPTAKQRTALEWRGVRCTVKGCPARQFLEIDHLIEWARTKHTTLDELEWLCPHHHKLKTHHNYQLEPGTGPRQLLPPQPPRPPTPTPNRTRQTRAGPDTLPLSA